LYIFHLKRRKVPAKRTNIQYDLQGANYKSK
jgi:hypothetical protein